MEDLNLVTDKEVYMESHVLHHIKLNLKKIIGKHPYDKSGRYILKKEFIEELLEKMTQILEMIIAVIIAMGVIIGLVDLVRYFPEILSHDAEGAYDIFQNFLGHALILIVGVELMLMIINQSTRGILELVLFVIARKMLIYSGSMLDLVLGTVAIAIVFIILKFLVNTNDDEILIRKGRTKGNKKENNEKSINELDR